MVERFGQGVVGEDGRINRKALGAIVFGHKVCGCGCGVGGCGCAPVCVCVWGVCVWCVCGVCVCLCAVCVCLCAVHTHMCLCCVFVLCMWACVSEQLLQSVSGVVGRHTHNKCTVHTYIYIQQDKMKELTDIVWPEIHKLAQKEIQEAFKQGELQDRQVRLCSITPFCWCTEAGDLDLSFFY